MRAITLPDDEPLLDRFYADVYLPAFAHQREPLETWKQRLAGGPYDLTIAIEHEDGAPIAGVAFEHYRESRTGLITYGVVAPHARRRGLGRALIDHAVESLRGRGATLVLGELHDPAKGGDPGRLARFRRWGARVVDVPYVQPDLGFGRDRELLLIAFHPRQGPIAGLAAFFHEFFRHNEGGDPSGEEIAALLASCQDPVTAR